EKVCQAGRNQVAANLAMVVGVPDCRRLGQPGLPLENHVQDDIKVKEHIHRPYFLLSSSSSVRSHSSSVGVGVAGRNMAVTSSADKPCGWLGRPGAGIVSRVARIRCIRAIRMEAGQDWTRWRTSATALVSATVIVGPPSTWMHLWYAAPFV